VRCVRAAASGANAPDTGSAERGGWVLPAASLAHFFARTLASEKQGLEVKSECSGLKRMNDKGFMCAVVKLCGVKRNNAATTRIIAWEKT
jgi:hypothetical protein